VEIAVLIKQVPDTDEVRMDPERGTVIREGVGTAVNPLDLNALEEALRWVARLGGSVTALSMGPLQAEEALREALALGADRAVLLSDRAFAGSDSWATAVVLARALRKLGPFDSAGRGRGGSRPAVEAKWISYPHQVGLSGKVVSPKLYLAVGISGSVQHLAGMQTARRIVAVNRHARERLWKIRKNIHEGVMADRPERTAAEDVVVPTAAIPALMEDLERLARERPVDCLAFGHMGDGNMHVYFVPRGEDPDWRRIVREARLDLYRTVSALGGTLTGEHGVGLKRAADLPLFLDEAQIGLIRRVKRAFDPEGILNPGKILP
jgi:FAD/FMN-containing dehydrogenase